MFFHTKKLNLTIVQDLLISSLFVSFAIAMLDVIGALYLSELGFTNSQIGFILTFVVFLNILFKLISTPILEKFNEYKLYLFQIALLSVLYLLVFYISNIYFFVFVLICTLVLIGLGDNAFGIIFKDLSKKDEFENNESLLYGISNIAWVIGPLLLGFFLDKFQFSYIFLLISGIFFFGFLFSVLIKVELKEKKRKKIDSNPFANIKDFAKNSHLIDSYIFSFICAFHYSFIFIFMLLEVEKYFGIFYGSLFVAMTQFPLVFIQLKMNYFTKKFSTIKLIYYSFFTLAIIYIVCFIFSFNFLLTTIILLLSAFALAFLEPLKEVFFFEYTNENEEEKFYPLFLTANDTGSLISKLIIGLMLLFLDFKFIFLLIFLLICYAIFRIHTSKSYPLV